MIVSVVVDTGPLVAAFDQRDALHARSAEMLKTIRAPMLTCEAVLAETWFLLQRAPNAWGRLERWIERGILVIDFQLEPNRAAIFALMRKYRDLPMSLADACLVALADANREARVFTFDRHFALYRAPSRRKVKTVGLEE